MLGDLEADRSLWDLSGNPLYLTLLAMIVEDGGSPSSMRERTFERVGRVSVGTKGRDGAGKAEEVRPKVEKGARAREWKRMLEEGVYGSRAELARAMGVSRAAVTQAMSGCREGDL